MTDYICSYRPLCITPAGRRAADKYGLPRFVDHSCRREPDFTAAHPTISSLCRADKFAPKLMVGDGVVYMTRKQNYGAGVRVRYLVACLRVVQRFESHYQAAKWFRSKDLPLPSNCMVPNNHPTQASKTAFPDEHVTGWDNVYQYRAKHWGAFLVCTAEAMELTAPPLIDGPTLEGIFGRIPGTQNPSRISKLEYDAMKRLCVAVDAQ